jgi:hypothetical protein
VLKVRVLFNPEKIMRETGYSSIVAALSVVAQDLKMTKAKDYIYSTQPFESKELARQAVLKSIYSVKKNNLVPQWPLPALQIIAAKFFEIA